MLRKAALLTVLCLALPMAAFANSTDFVNQGGTWSGSTLGLTLSNSTIISVSGLNGGGLITGNLGTISLTTGAMMDGASLSDSGTFAAGGTFTTTGSGMNGVPSGPIFSGIFSQPATWIMSTSSAGMHTYTLTGVVLGTLANGTPASFNIQLSVGTGHGWFNVGSLAKTSGLASLESVAAPEPGTLTLFGLGLIGLAGVIWRKLSI